MRPYRFFMRGAFSEVFPFPRKGYRLCKNEIDYPSNVPLEIFRFYWIFVSNGAFICHVYLDYDKWKPRFYSQEWFLLNIPLDYASDMIFWHLKIAPDGQHYFVSYLNPFVILFFAYLNIFFILNFARIDYMYVSSYVYKLICLGYRIAVKSLCLRLHHDKYICE